MKYIILLGTLLLMSACGAHTPLNEWYTDSNKPVGSKSYDPQSGDWIFIQNEPFAAQRQAEREHGWKWGDPNPPW